MNFKLYKVGGCVRDEILGLSSTDIDYTVVMNEPQPSHIAFEQLQSELEGLGYKIFITIPERFTIRSEFPNSKLISDFVLSVNQNGMTGTLRDDLLRRDFTMNSMAIDEFGNVIDVVGGKEDIENQVIRCPSDPFETICSDPIRIFRALRFKVQFNFKMHPSVWFAIAEFPIDNFKDVRMDKMVEEMIKMFRINSAKSMELFLQLRQYNLELYNWVFENVWLRTNLKK